MAFGGRTLGHAFLSLSLKTWVIRRTGMVRSRFLHARASAHAVSHPSNIFPTLIPIGISGLLEAGPMRIIALLCLCCKYCLCLLANICSLLFVFPTISFGCYQVVVLQIAEYIMIRLCGDGTGNIQAVD